MGLADSMIFFPPPPSYGEEDGPVFFESAGAGRVAGFHLPRDGARLTVLFAHGNAEDAGQVRPLAGRIAELGVSVLLFDYPGYGLTGGSPSEPGAFAAAAAAYRFVTDVLGVAPNAVVAHGRSLGGAVMADLASRVPVGGLVLESTFVSAFRVITGRRLLPFDKFEALRKVSNIDVPALVIHGTADAVIPAWHGRRLHEALPGPVKRGVWVPGAGHNDLALVGGDLYWSALDDLYRVVEAGLGRVSPPTGPGA